MKWEADEIKGLHAALAYQMPKDVIVVGKGPTFCKPEFGYVIALNHALSKLDFASALFVVDIDVIEDLGAELRKADRVFMPLYPHVKCEPGPALWEHDLPHLREMARRGRVYLYEHTGRPAKGATSLEMPEGGWTFSAGLCAHLLGRLGVETMLTYGVDGGTSYADDFADSEPLGNGRSSYDAQFETIEQARIKYGVQHTRGFPMPYRDYRRVYQMLYDSGRYGRAMNDTCPGVRYLGMYADWLRSPVADVGAGSGDTVRAMRARGLDAHGFDWIDAEDVHTTDITDPDFDISGYRSALCIDVLEHVPGSLIPNVLRAMGKTERQVIQVADWPDVRLGVDLHVTRMGLNGWRGLIGMHLDILRIEETQEHRWMFFCQRKAA